MGKVILTGSGSAGSGSDECTATKAEVLRGYTAITGDSDDEVVEGSLELIGDAADSQVLAGKTFYNTNPKIQRTGSMVNHGAISQMLTAGGNYIIPAGYHNGSGKVMAGSLASQTYGTATAAQILSGQTVWVNGNKLIGTMAVQSILSFSAAVYSSTAIAYTWKNPAKGPFSGVIIVGKTGSYPTSITDGTRYYKGTGNNTTSNGISSAIVSSFAGGTNYYFRAFSYAIKDGSEWIPATTYTATAATTKGRKVFTASGVFTVPSNVRSIDLFSVGGGGSGGRRTEKGSNQYTGGGGGGGYTTTEKNISVSPGDVIQVTIGAAGINYKRQAGSSYFTINNSQRCLAAGGYGGGDSYSSNAGKGGSGGGHSGWLGTGGSNPTYGGGAGGSNGSNGSSVSGASGGAGQGTTTRAFGESFETLYAGGGGGGACNAAGGAGGAGGGGTGGGNWASPVLPIANTGSGGGGQGTYMGDMTNSKGASGVCIIRWGY